MPRQFFPIAVAILIVSFLLIIAAIWVNPVESSVDLGFEEPQLKNEASAGLVSGYVFSSTANLWAKGKPGVEAIVTLKNSALTLTRITTTRLADGYYLFGSLPTGNYSISIEAQNRNCIYLGNGAPVWNIYFPAGTIQRVSFAFNCQIPTATATTTATKTVTTTPTGTPTATATPPTATPTPTPSATLQIGP